MARIMLTQSAALAGVALVTLGLWTWGTAEVFAQQADRVAVAAWSVRCLAVGAIASGQLLFALVVLPAFFKASSDTSGGSFELVLRMGFGLVALLSLVAGGALTAAAGW